MEWYWMTLGILCVWRVTHLLQGEDGPGHIVVRFRRLLGNGFWADLLDCFYCSSFWVAVPFAWLIGGSLQEQLLLILALSGAAILLERATSQPESTSASILQERAAQRESAPAPYWKEE